MRRSATPSWWTIRRGSTGFEPVPPPHGSRLWWLPGVAGRWALGEIWACTPCTREQRTTHAASTHQETLNGRTCLCAPVQARSSTSSTWRRRRRATRCRALTIANTHVPRTSALARTSGCMGDASHRVRLSATPVWSTGGSGTPRGGDMEIKELPAELASFVEHALAIRLAGLSWPAPP
jgi:hypothetical protein